MLLREVHTMLGEHFFHSNEAGNSFFFGFLPAIKWLSASILIKSHNAILIITWSGRVIIVSQIIPTHNAILIITWSGRVIIVSQIIPKWERTNRGFNSAWVGCCWHHWHYKHRFRFWYGEIQAAQATVENWIPWFSSIDYILQMRRIRALQQKRTMSRNKRSTPLFCRRMTSAL